MRNAPMSARHSFHWSRPRKHACRIPYFVPGAGSDGRARQHVVSGGRDVRILTNSLAANDVAAVHGGYARHRKDLLEGGVQIWELKPLPGTQRTASLFGSSGRACTPRRLRSTAAGSSSAATTSIRARPG